MNKSSTHVSDPYFIANLRVNFNFNNGNTKNIKKNLKTICSHYLIFFILFFFVN